MRPTASRFVTFSLAAAAIAASLCASAQEDGVRRFTSEDVFGLEYAADPEISPDGGEIVYVRRSNDIMSDTTRSNLWIAAVDGSYHRPLLSGRQSYSSPRFSPDGDRLAYVSSAEGSPQLYMRWMETGATALVTNLTAAPASMAWSPNGDQIAFTMEVPAQKTTLAKPPAKPEGADWAEPVTVIDSVIYRFDGRGFLEPAYSHVFVVPAEGGSVRQLTSSDYSHRGPLSWSADGSRIFFAANRGENWEYERTEIDLYAVSVSDGAITRLTDLPGIESDPVAAPNGSAIAFLRGDHQKRPYWTERLALIDPTGSDLRILTPEFDHSVDDPVWAADGSGLYVSYDDRGRRRTAFIKTDGRRRTLAAELT